MLRIVVLVVVSGVGVVGRRGPLFSPICNFFRAEYTSLLIATMTPT